MIEFRVIGELRNDPGHVVLLDTEGQAYDYDVSRGEVVAVEPDGTWAVDVIEEGQLMMVLPSDKIVASRSAAARVS